MQRHHRERSAAARVSVELREDDAVEGDTVLERLRDRDRFLAGHRVEHEQDVRRLRRVAHRGELFHERLVDVQPARSVEDDDVLALALGRRSIPPVVTAWTGSGAVKTGI